MFKISVRNTKDRVFIDFSQPVMWIGILPTQADYLATQLISAAKNIRVPGFANLAIKVEVDWPNVVLSFPHKMWWLELTKAQALLLSEKLIASVNKMVDKEIDVNT